MTEHSWIETRNRAIDLFGGETPGAALEEDILAHFTEQPVRVEQAIASVAERKAAGKIVSAWAVLRRQLETETHTDVRVDDQGERRTAVERARRWIRGAGMHYHEADLIDELYRRKGPLAPWPDTEPEIRALWRSLQPIVEQLEVDQRVYDAECAEAAQHQLARRTDRFTEAQREVLARHALADTEQLIRQTDPTPPEPALT